jgi:four helix bundle protein
MWPFEELEVWKRSARLSAGIYQALAVLKFGFRGHLTRASQSIPSNIAEGFERRSTEETANFLNCAKGSVGELWTKSNIGKEIGSVKREQATQMGKCIGRNVQNALRTDPSRPLSCLSLATCRLSLFSHD